MRFYAASVALGLLALSALVTDAERGESIPESGGEYCRNSALQRDAHGDVPNRQWLAGLLRVTCDLDGTLLWMENYYRADSGERLSGRLRASHRRQVDIAR